MKHKQLVLCFCCLLSLCSLLVACDSGPGAKKSLSTPPVPTQVASVQCSAHTKTPVTLSMAYGSEKQKWITDVVADFNNRHLAACDGVITVNATPLGSGDSMRQIASGQIQPDIWSPAGSVWLTLLNDLWIQKHSSPLISLGATDTPPLVNSPIVIAMWEPEARALGWPDKPIGWSDIAKISTDPGGWASYGHAEFGDFKFGHTHPDYSNSGLDAVIAMNYAATHKTRNLTREDVGQSQTKDFVAQVESSVIHYGDSTGFFADKMFKNGPSYLSATVMYENLIVEANTKTSYPNLPYPVVAIYPKEGTFQSDHPFAILQGSWMNPSKQAAAQVFRDFLLAVPQQQKALHYGFRPANLQVAIGAPLDSTHGVDPKQPSSALPVPPAEIVKAIKASWDMQRRKVDVMLILDRSGSMNDSVGGTSKIAGAKQGLSEFVDLLGDSDGLGLTIFSSGTDVLTPISGLGAKRTQTLNAIKNVLANGNTRLFNTISEQYRALQNLPSKHIKALVVLTDGQDTVNQMTLQQLISQITPVEGDTNSGERIKIFTIAYGNQQDVDVNALTTIASASGGQEYSGNPQNIRQVYQSISTFF